MMDFLVMLRKPLLQLLEFVLRDNLLCFTVRWAIANDRLVSFELHVVTCTAVCLLVGASLVSIYHNKFVF